MSHSAAHNDHIGRQEACRVCVCPEADLLLVLLWCSSGDFTLKVCDQVTARRLLPRYDECLRIVRARLKSCHFFSYPPGVWLQLELAAEGKPGRKTSGRSSPWNLNCEISAATSAGEPPSPQRSSSDSLPSAGSKKKKKKSKTLRVCYWFKYFPKLQAQETVVVLAARPARRQKSFQRNIGLKNDRRKRETG